MYLMMDELRNTIIQRVSSKSAEEIRFKSQTRGEPDLTLEEKQAIVTDVLDKSPSQFLYRFGLTLQLGDLEFFRQFPEDFDVCYHVRNLEERLNAERLRTLTKNRRFAAVPRLQRAGYFNDLEMQKRDPLLYEELVEKYLTEDEKIALQNARDLSERASERAGQSHPFADLLMASLIEKPAVDALRDCQRERDAEQTEELEEDEDEGDNETSPEPAAMVIDERGRELLHHEFRLIMQERFLGGKDSQHLNYEEIDMDATLDDNEVSARDQEDRYFEDEEPSPRQLKKFRLAEEDCSSDDMEQEFAPDL